MTRAGRLLERVLRGTSDADVPFAGICRLLRALGFEERIRGSHHIFAKNGVGEILNLQPRQGRAKPYQIRQIRQVILKYKLEVESP
ncbi:MAG: type II toxin-antitoxin system HicA family toxin [Acidobacteriota bacterium]